MERQIIKFICSKLYTTKNRILKQPVFLFLLSNLILINIRSDGVTGSIPVWLTIQIIYGDADVAKLADALDLGSSAFGHVGSSPSIRTNNNQYQDRQ